MATQVAVPDSLDQLQSPEQVALLDAIDKLRNQGLSHYDIGLPQLIVCGDQSSGKSSVLEALTRLRFPTKDGLCTTFATELVLRKETNVRISCTITPGSDRTPAQRRELAKFKRSFSSREDFLFPSLLDEAKECMTIGSTSETGPFLKDVLQIKYSGPDLPSLTIVDLPGLIQSQLRGDTEKAVKCVHELVKGYMLDEKSIILAVVSARNDLENQAVFEKIQQVDPKACRTLGIITKPDTLDTGSDSEAKFIRLAKNQIKHLELGWHVVKNRSFTMREQSDAERDESERSFFSTGPWNTLSRSDVGIDTLRTKLSKVLLRHICQELPSLIVNIQDAIVDTESSLKALGSPRDSEGQQRIYLSEKAQIYQNLTNNALRGTYQDPFFQNENAPTRLRTEIQNLNLAFVHLMYLKGHKWEITEEQHSSNAKIINFPSDAIQDYVAAQIKDPDHLSRNSLLRDEIGPMVRKNRQPGLPTLVNLFVIGEVFRKQSEQWREIAKFHLEQVFEAVKTYMHLVLEPLMDSQTFNMLLMEHIHPELDKKWDKLSSKLEELLVPYEGLEPITYDPSYVPDLNSTRARRYTEPKAGGFGSQNNAFSQPLPPRHVLTESIDDHANSEILDFMQTYYKGAISVFINNVAVLAIENCLVASLEKLFCPILVQLMSAEQLQNIASESEEIQCERAALKQKLEDLKAGKRILNIQACRSGSVRMIPRERRTPTPTQPTRIRDSRPPQKEEPRNDIEQAAVEGMVSEFRFLAVTPPPTDPKTRPRSRARNPAVTPTKSASARRIRGWPPRYDSVASAKSDDSEDEGPMLSGSTLQP